MAEKDFNNLVNISAERAKGLDEINNRDFSQNHIDKMTSYFQTIKAKNNKIEKDEFLGYVLFTNLITVKNFENIYDQSSAFFKELMYNEETVEPRKDASIIQYRVHIPEITGMLPFPDFSKYARYFRIMDEAWDLDSSVPEEKKKFDKMKKEAELLKEEFFPELMKIDLFPKFYQYTEKSSAYGVLPGLFCKVKVTNTLPTKGSGFVLKVYDEAVSTLGLGASL